jgi:hypothetical protein
MRGVDCPSDFLPNENNRENARKFGLNLQNSVEAFLDYHISKGNRFVDWHRALNTWLRNEVKFASRYSPPPQTHVLLDPNVNDPARKQAKWNQ